jgi:hypothetical protein
MSQLVPSPLFMVPGTGELLAKDDPQDAATGLHQLLELQQQIDELNRILEQTLIDESQRQGTKTLKFANGLIVKIEGGGTRTRYDQPARLHQALQDAGLPPERLEQAVPQILIYKPNGNVLRQLYGANPEYAAILDEHKTETPEPHRVKIG